MTQTDEFTHAIRITVLFHYGPHCVLLPGRSRVQKAHLMNEECDPGTIGWQRCGRGLVAKTTLTARIRRTASKQAISTTATTSTTTTTAWITCVRSWMPPRLEAQTGASLRCDTNSIMFRNQLRTCINHALFRFDQVKVEVCFVRVHASVRFGSITRCSGGTNASHCIS